MVMVLTTAALATVSDQARTTFASVDKLVQSEAEDKIANGIVASLLDRG